MSASGKSTLGRLAKGLLEPNSGRFILRYAQNRSHHLSARNRLETVGWAEPHPEKQFFASKVREEIAFGPENQGLKGRELEKRVFWAIQLVDLEPDHYLERDPRSLSGGEQRRLALASIIAFRTPFYIFDEPTAGLDYKGRCCFKALLVRLRDEGCGIVWITHKLKLLQNVADRIWGLEKGELLIDSPAAKVDWEILSDLLEQGRSLKGIGLNRLNCSA